MRSMDLKNGLDMSLLLDEATPRIAAFAWLDLIVAAVVVLVWALNKSLLVRADSRWLSSAHEGSASLGVAALPSLGT